LRTEREGLLCRGEPIVETVLQAALYFERGRKNPCQKANHFRGATPAAAMSRAPVANQCERLNEIRQGMTIYEINRFGRSALHASR
jgi:hypothetical protein